MPDEAGIYGPAFDAQGRLVAIELPAPLFRQARGLTHIFWKLSGGRFNRVVVRPAETTPAHQEALVDLIASVLPASAIPATRDLTDLVARAVEQFGLR